MKTEIKYRTFQDLIDSVKIDFPNIAMENFIDDQQLIKVAMRVNYDLGLKINQSKSRAIEITKGKGKLPSDFDVLNFALLCDNKTVYEDVDTSKSYSDGLLEGVILAQKVLEFNNVYQFSTIVDIAPGANVINHNLHTQNLILQAFAEDNTILSFEIEMINNNSLKIISDATVTLNNVKVIVIGAKGSLIDNAGACEIDDTEVEPALKYFVNNKRYKYKKLIPLKIERSKSVSEDCFNFNSKSEYTAFIRNGFIVTNFTEGLIYINYQSLMEDDNGDLLVMDHPFTNEYYEYALKQRILENMMFLDENVINKLQYIEQRYKTARMYALSYINTPDFGEMKQVWEMNRKAQYHKYYNMFKSRMDYDY